MLTIIIKPKHFMWVAIVNPFNIFCLLNTRS